MCTNLVARLPVPSPNLRQEKPCVDLMRACETTCTFDWTLPSDLVGLSMFASGSSRAMNNTF